MATFRKRGDKWFTEINIKGVRKGKSFPTKAQAKNWATETEFKLSQQSEGVSHSHTLRDIFERYATEVSSTKKGERWEVVRLNAYSKFAIADVRLVDLKREHFEDWIQLRLKVVKPSSVNRDLNLMSHCLTQARRWRLMTHKPLDDLKRPKNPPHRDRRISPEEEAAIIFTLNYDPANPVTQQQQKIAVAFLLAIETAMRQGEITGLTAEHVDLESRVAHLPMTKNGMSRDVPLSTTAVSLLRSLEPWPVDGPLFGISSSAMSTLFRRAVLRSGIEDLTFHDSRHEAITRLAGKLDVLDLARMVGHRDIKQLLTYFNRSAKDMATQLD